MELKDYIKNVIKEEITLLEQFFKTSRPTARFANPNKVIWTKKIKYHDNWGTGFFGSTFDLKDIFNQITKENLSSVNAKKRFYWNNAAKCWWTLNNDSVDRAKKLIALRLNSQWFDNRINFKAKDISKTEPIVKKGDLKMPLEQLEHIRKCWYVSKEDLEKKRFSQEISTIDANKAWYCPNCGEFINRSALTPIRDNTPDNEVTHWTYTCKNCDSKLTIWND